jgi:3-isopropylmalate/(R)-2-methylmalate dehydratase small subunit
LTLDLETLEITHPDGLKVAFTLDPYARETLLHGLDDIARTLKREDAIAAYEASISSRFDTRSLA